MRLSTKGRYAVTAMMEIAMRQNEGPVTLADISQTQGISNSYLEQLFSMLRKNGLVKGVRGPRGGYRLAREAGEITVADIILAVDEKLETMRCEGRGDCHDGEPCLTHELWQELSDKLYNFLNGITLDQYVNRPGVQELAARRQEQLSSSTPSSSTA
ncbi:MAG TPA: Rrf2 family transcriptional regulator [Gammaproteobacteria bacterium]|nr:Rrf2 family transcriptional regulator [Gammaproteobacteria bacterium]